MLKSDALSHELATKLFKQLHTGDLSPQNISDLGLAKLKGWLREQPLDAILNQDPNVRAVVLERIAEYNSKDMKVPPIPVPELINRIGGLNDQRKQGVITEATMRHLSDPSAHDTMVAPLIKTEAAKAPTDRISAKNIEETC